MSVFADSRLVIINSVTNCDSITYIPTRDKLEVGYDLQSDIRIVHENVLSKHFEIYFDNTLRRVRNVKKSRVVFCLSFFFLGNSRPKSRTSLKTTRFK